MSFYAIEHTYGANSGDSDGHHIGEVVAFPTKTARDRWVSQRPTEYTTDPGYREALTYLNRADRHAIQRFREESRR